MHQAATAYGQTAKMTLPPRELEASLLLKAAGYLQEVIDGWPESQKYLDAALYYNRRLWSVLVDSVTNPDNPLPLEIKNNIANLALFIFNRTIDMKAKPEAKKLDVLVNINRQIAAGLSARVG